jgi:hypothetical protein
MKTNDYLLRQSALANISNIFGSAIASAFSSMSYLPNASTKKKLWAGNVKSALQPGYSHAWSMKQ